MSKKKITEQVIENDEFSEATTHLETGVEDTTARVESPPEHPVEVTQNIPQPESQPQRESQPQTPPQSQSRGDFQPQQPQPGSADRFDKNESDRSFDGQLSGRSRRLKRSGGLGGRVGVLVVAGCLMLVLGGGVGVFAAKNSRDDGGSLPAAQPAGRVAKRIVKPLAAKQSVKKAVRRRVKRRPVKPRRRRVVRKVVVVRQAPAAPPARVVTPKPTAPAAAGPVTKPKPKPARKRPVRDGWEEWDWEGDW